MTDAARATIAIPTYNRARLLREAVASALAQDYDDFQVVVFDNASTDDTEAVVRSFRDARLTYVRHPENIGLFRNWNRCLEHNRSPFVAVLQDDDLLMPCFLRDSIGALERHPGAALSFSPARYIDIDGSPLHLQDGREWQEGILSGTEYLHSIVAGRNWVLHITTMVLRAAALSDCGPFDVPHSKHALDFNLYVRLAARWDMVFIPKELASVRRHAGQDSKMRFQAEGGTGPLSTMAERTDAAALLLRSPRAADPKYVEWVAGRLLHISMRRSELTHHLLPELNISWRERLETAREEVARLVPPGGRFILVDEGEFPPGTFPGRQPVPFMERDGSSWGSPSGDAAAIEELERQRRQETRLVVFAWPAFWWLDFYAGLREHLESRHRRLLQTSSLIVYELL